MSGRCLEHVWKVSGICLDGVWTLFGRYLEGIWKVFGGSLEIFCMVPGWCLGNINIIMPLKGMLEYF